MKSEDGGYYAIKGFKFQFIQSLGLLLDKESPNDHISLEQIEDIETENTLIQVKYKEAVKYTKSTIKKPLMKLLEESKQTNSQLKLYCYFTENINFKNDMKLNDDLEKDKEYKIDIDYLDKILSDNKEDFTEKEKESFIERFFIVFNDSYIEEVKLVIKKIKEIFYIENDNAALIIFNQFLSHLEYLVVSNNSVNRQKRICYRKELDDIKENSNKIIINEFISQILDKEEYYNVIKKECRLTGQLSSYEKVFIINIDSDITDLYKFIGNIENKFFKKSKVKNKYKIDSPAPYIYLNISEDELLKIKENLYNNNIFFVDGYPFENSKFKISDLIQPTTIHSGFTVKFINGELEFSNLKRKFNNKKIRYYNFYSDNEGVLNIDNEIADVYNIKVNSVRDINQYIF